MRDLFHPQIDQIDLPTVLHALGDPVRLRILRKLYTQGESTCSCCSDEMQKSALSHHFKVLREAGLVKVRIDGKQRFMELRLEDMEVRFPGLLVSVLKNIMDHKI